MKFTGSLLFGLFMISMALVSCRKDKLEEAIISLRTSKDNALIEQAWNDVYRISDEVASQTDELRSTSFTCVDAVIVDTTVTPHTLLIDFGNENCTGTDGRTRRGRLFLTFSGRYRDPGTVITISPQDFYINDQHLEGLKTVTNMGENELGQMYFTIEVEDGLLTSADESEVISWESSRIRTWVAGQDTWWIWDDEYEITGSASGINRLGVPYQAQILSALHVSLGCPWIVSGSVQMSPEGYDPRILDFGNGNCDNQATVTVNGDTYQIFL